MQPKPIFTPIYNLPPSDRDFLREPNSLIHPEYFHLFLKGRASDEHFLHVVIVGGDAKVRVVGRGPELVAGHDEEDKGGHLLEHLVQPLVLEGNRDLEQVDNDAGEIDVANDHDVKVSEDKRENVEIGIVKI